MRKNARLLPARFRMFPAGLMIMSSFLIAFSSGCEHESSVNTEIKLDKTNLSLNKGGTYTLTATVTPESNYTVVWESDNSDVATVDEGVVTAVAEGSAKIIVSIPKAGCSAECVVEVKDDVPVTITLDKTSLSLEAGDSYTLQTAAAPEGDYSIVWKSDNSDVATVDEGVVTAVAEGSAKITVSIPEEGCSAECMVEVVKTEITISLDKTELSLAKDEQYTLHATVTPEGRDYDIVWTTGDDEIATVVDGVVTAVNEGSTKITASIPDAGCSAECTVTVPDTSEPIDIPDNAFKNYLLENPEINKNMDDNITVNEAKNFFGRISLPAKGGDKIIKSIEGIQYFVNIESFVSGYFNKIEVLDFSNCVRLKAISIPSMPEVREIILPEDCSTIETLDLQTTSIKELDLSSCTNLTQLNISWCNELTAIDLTPVCKKLRLLYMIRVPKINISGLENKFDALEHLNAQYTKDFTVVPEAPMLTFMDILGTGVESVDCAKYPEVTLVQASDVDLIGFDTSWEKLRTFMINYWHVESADLRNKTEIENVVIQKAGALRKIIIGSRRPIMKLPSEVEVVYE